MRVDFGMSAIVAALAILAGSTLAGCGQSGPLYMPVVPPMPPKPNFQTQPPGDNVRPAPDTASTAASASDASGATANPLPDATGTPLSLSPDDELDTTPHATTMPAAPQPASGTASPQ
ncbi:hypothetical protein CY652_16005 [Burkholderia sp. WAC0059]|uniref:LPS translocon maturation chaperone LptM n=1 Tax=Burkholderia sp. WAC0059 TaxID=2066022 RepID=UPI000C7E9D0C|nr:lipoprotein [Burkholderia sp. WAC0059]PLZ01340.1 hypothetical protein CY652_16005 [Burkholderia sp. WAC0059]